MRSNVAASVRGDLGVVPKCDEKFGNVEAINRGNILAKFRGSRLE